MFTRVLLKVNCSASLRGIPSFHAGKEGRALLGSNLSASPGGVQGMGCPLFLNFGVDALVPRHAVNPLLLPLRGGGGGGGAYSYFT